MQAIVHNVHHVELITVNAKRRRQTKTIGKFQSLFVARIVAHFKAARAARTSLVTPTYRIVSGPTWVVTGIN